MSRFSFNGFIAYLIVTGVLTVISCENKNGGMDPGDGGEVPDDVSFSTHIQPIFTTRCALSGCHSGSSPAQSMNLGIGQAYDDIVNIPSTQRPSVMRVRPGSPEESYLYRKIIGNDIDGSRMPLTGGSLSSTQINTIKKWIEENALNN